MKQFVLGFIAAAWCCVAMAQTAPAAMFYYNGSAWVPWGGGASPGTSGSHCSTITGHGTLTPAGATALIPANATRCQLLASAVGPGTCSFAYAGSDVPSATVGHPLGSSATYIETTVPLSINVYCPVGTTLYYEDISPP